MSATDDILDALDDYIDERAARLIQRDRFGFGASPSQAERDARERLRRALSDALRPPET